MYPDAFTVERLAIELDNSLRGLTVRQIFSSSPKQIYFVFNSGKGLEVQFFKGLGLLNPSSPQNFPLKNRLNQFEPIFKSQITCVNPHVNSRSFEIEFSCSYRLVFKLFGKFSNLVLFNEEKKPISIFRQNLHSDLTKPYSQFNSEIQEYYPDVQEPDFLQCHPWFNAGAIQFLKKLNYFKADHNKRKELLQTFKKHCLTGKVYVLKDGKGHYQLGLFEEHSVVDHAINLLDLIESFNKLKISSESFFDQKQYKINEIQKSLKKENKLLELHENQLKNLKSKRSYKEIADLIMANLHSIHKGSSHAELVDFYRGSKIRLKLKTDRSAQQNAAIYYEKSKNEQKERYFKEKVIQESKTRIQALREQLEKFESAENIRSLRKLIKEEQPSSKYDSAKTLPYHEYEIDSYKIYVGKHAKGNDFLLREISNKNDWWFHSRETSGSHVIVKHKGQSALPRNVLEKASNMAAYYSKARTNSVVPVIYTQRKFVRKPKGGAAGAVLVQNEKVVMADPAQFQAILK